VDTDDFKGLDTKDKFYFEPFETEIRKYVRARKRFVLPEIAPREKIFQMDTVYVIHRDSLLRTRDT
jgi:hypothetical protein